MDALGSDEASAVRAEAARREDVVVLSGLSGEGVDALLTRAGEHLRLGATLRTIALPAGGGEAIAWLHANGEVVGQRSEENETEVDVRLFEADWARFRTRFHLPA